jgi:RHS repeat-associated protein
MANGVIEHFYPIANSLYSTAALTDTSGQVIEKFIYNAFGNQTITDGSGNITRRKSAAGFDRGWTGYAIDGETGLANARNRMYSPELGRFVGRDPWTENPGVPRPLNGYLDGLSLYSAYFVPNGTDPFGTWTCAEIIADYQMAIGGLKVLRKILAEGVKQGPGGGLAGAGGGQAGNATGVGKTPLLKNWESNWANKKSGVEGLAMALTFGGLADLNNVQRWALSEIWRSNMYINYLLDLGMSQDCWDKADQTTTPPGQPATPVSPSYPPANNTPRDPPPNRIRCY